MKNKLYFKCDFDGEYLIRIIQIENSKNLNNKEKEISQKINDYIEGKTNKLDIKYKLIGTKFQETVWKELEKIPYGETRTYKQIAINIGNKNASRAVGMACNKNVLPIIVPCHRVVGSNGKLTGFIYGTDIKKQILLIEKLKK